MPDYKIFAIFEKYYSWSKDTSISTLNHEQLHFDIGELYARKMREAIFELREQADNSNVDYIEILDNYYKICLDINSLYDNETAHGIYKGKQEEWQKKIAQELSELKKYEVDYSEYLEE